MNLTINSPTFPIGENLRELIQERVVRAIGRISSKIQDVTIVLTDVNGSRGGIDKHCRITVAMSNGVLTSDALDENVLSAVDQASRKVRRVIIKKLQRPRSVFRRGRVVEFPEFGNEPGSISLPQ